MVLMVGAVRPVVGRRLMDHRREDGSFSGRCVTASGGQGVRASLKFPGGRCGVWRENGIGRCARPSANRSRGPPLGALRARSSRRAPTVEPISRRDVGCRLRPHGTRTTIIMICDDKPTYAMRQPVQAGTPAGAQVQRGHRGRGRGRSRSMRARVEARTLVYIQQFLAVLSTCAHPATTAVLQGLRRQAGL